MNQLNHSIYLNYFNKQDIYISFHVFIQLGKKVSAKEWLSKYWLDYTGEG